MDYQEALQMALEKEKAAVELYRKLYIDHPAMKELFEFLMNEEEKHVKLIEKKISESYKAF
jgi:rubrerythrin